MLALCFDFYSKWTKHSISGVRLQNLSIDDRHETKNILGEHCNACLFRPVVFKLGSRGCWRNSI